MMTRPFNLTIFPILLFSLVVFGSISEGAKRTLADVPDDLDDARIAVAIKKKFARVDRRAFSSLEVSVKDGVATLTGTTDTLWTQERARELCQVIRGVRGVIDRVSVGPTGSTGDSALRQQLEHLFLDDPVVERQEVHLHIKEGIVTLEGKVQSRQEKQAAVNLSKMVKGVREVRDNLAVQVSQNRPDSVLQKEIMQRVTFDVWVDRPDLLNVDVQKGKAILTGQVGNAYEKRRVSELAWVDGIRKVDASGVKVSWVSLDSMERFHRPLPSDQEISAAIQKILSSDYRVSSFGIQVTVKHGRVTLNGDVPFLSIKREAEKDVNNTLGVQSVDNRLEVRGDTSLTDVDIRARILAALARDPVLEQFKIDVTVKKRTALLTGTVESLYERNHAENLTSRIPGVNSLMNQILFSAPGTAKTDWEIQLDIENQLWWSPFLNDQDIVATVEDGKATLTGSVEHIHQRLIAEQQAFEAGASAVINQVRVRKRQVAPSVSTNYSRPLDQRA